MSAPNRQPVFRFAPSPNGFLHAGHAYSALLNADLAARLGGRLLLRIEDIDSARCKPEFDQAIREDLAWLGLRWEEPVLRQSTESARYRAALDDLLARDLAYRCTCSRQAIMAEALRGDEPGRPWPRDPDGAPVYPGRCRRHPPPPAAGPAALRLKSSPADMPEGLGWREHAADLMPAEWVSAPACGWGDVVVGRKDIGTSYHLAVVLDDALQGVTHVVRGTDLKPATAIHRLLQEHLCLPAPVYVHHPLLADSAGAKLSKSLGSRSLRDMRREGATPADIRRLAGLSPA